MTRNKLIQRLHDIKVMVRAGARTQGVTELQILQQVIEREHQSDMSPVDDDTDTEPPGFEDDGDALASAGFSTDEDYGS